MTGQEVVELIVLVICFFVAAAASGTETALTSVGRLRVRFLAEQGSKAASILQRLRADPNRFLSTVLFVNTLALIVASTATALLSESLFTRWGVPEGLRLWLTLMDSVILSVILLIAATHPVLTGDAVERLKKADVDEVIVTDSVPISPEKLGPPITVLSVAPLLAEAIIRVHENRSVSELFR